MITFKQFLENTGNIIRLWRASDNDDVFIGMSLAEDWETAKLYTDNPGFGGDTIYFTNINLDNAEILELNDWQDLANILNLDDDEAYNLSFKVPGHNIAAAIPEINGLSEKISSLGYDWVKVAEDYPIDTITWQPVSIKAIQSIHLKKSKKQN